MTITINKKIKKRKINLIIPNYNELGYNLIILKNNDYDIILPDV